MIGSLVPLSGVENIVTGASAAIVGLEAFVIGSSAPLSSVEYVWKGASDAIAGS